MIAVGDKVVVFQNKEGGHTIAGMGQPIAIGDKVIVHQNEGNGFTITGQSIVAIGDTVIVLPEHE